MDTDEKKGAINKRDIELLLHDYTRYLEEEYLPLSSTDVYISFNTEYTISEYLHEIYLRIPTISVVE